MKLSLLLCLSLTFVTCSHAEPISLFDGKTFTGWEGDTGKVWRIEDGAVIAAGKLEEKAARNEVLATTRSYKNFDLRLKFKLLGTEGFVNSGVQFRSVRIPNPPNEMSGYQADIGDPKYWGALYDESRRRKMLAEPDMEAVNKVLKRNDWNDFRIRAEGPRIQIWINGTRTIDYTEPDPAIPQEGHLALQIHGNGKTEIRFKDLAIEELP
jgi:hypothetical protein